MILDEVKETYNQKLKFYSDSYQEILTKFIKLTEEFLKFSKEGISSTIIWKTFVCNFIKFV
jgi:hypothetical protein